MPDLKLPPENLNPLGGSDDFSYMMEYVQVHGGKATYMKLLTDITASPHNTSFNFNEEVLNKGPRIMAVYCLYIIKIKELTMLEFKSDTQLLIEGKNLNEDEISEYFTTHF